MGFFFFKAKLHGLVQAGFELTIVLGMALNSWSPYLYLPSSGVIDMGTIPKESLLF